MLFSASHTHLQKYQDCLLKFQILFLLLCYKVSMCLSQGPRLQLSPIILQSQELVRGRKCFPKQRELNLNLLSFLYAGFPLFSNPSWKNNASSPVRKNIISSILSKDDITTETSKRGEQSHYGRIIKLRDIELREVTEVSAVSLL